MTATLDLPVSTREPEVSRRQIALALRGDRDASTCIVKSLERPVLATIHRFLGRRFAGELEDIAQEIFVKVFANLQSFDPDRGVKLRTWVYSIARNHCFDLVKKRRLATASLDRISERHSRIPEPASPKPGPGATALRAELARRIEEAVQSLPPCQRMSFILREYEGLDYEAIAEVMDTNVGTTKSRLHRARSSLRRRLGPYLLAGEGNPA